MNAAKFKFDYELIRRGGNQLGVLSMAAGLIAYFIEPVAAGDAIALVLVGVFLFAASAIKFHNPKDE